MPQSESQRGGANARQYAWPAVLVGAVLLGVSFLPALAGGRERWTKQQALEYQQASLRIQELTHDLANQTPETASRQTEDTFRDALNHFDDLRSELQDAQSRSGYLSAVLRVAGLLLVVGGAIGLLPIKRKSAELRPFTMSRDTPSSR